MPTHQPTLLFRLAAVIAVACTCVLACAQWSTDPAAPLVVATPAGAPDGLRAFSDGNGGWYTFWRDKRADGTHFDVYGQRLDADGYPLWAANGALVYHEDSCSVSDFAIARLADGKLMLVTIAAPQTYADTMRALLLDADATPLWPTPVMITHAGSPVLVLGEPAVLPVSDGAIIGWYDTYFGGSRGVNVTRINMAGDVLWEPHGYAIPGATYGPFALRPDGTDGTVVIWRVGNGIGQGFKAMRVNGAGANAWAANMDVTPPGNGFGGNHVLLTGPEANNLMAYTNSANKVQFLQFTAAGTLLFDPSPIPVCGYASSQGQVSMVHEAGFTTVVWGDNRPPASNRDVYMQRFDSEGNSLLDSDGVLVMHLNTYIPTTGLVLSQDGSVIATIDSNVGGYSAMRMNADGTPAWPEPAAFCVPAHNPFYERQVQLPDGDGGIVSFWLTSGGTVHGGRIDANGTLGDHTGIGAAAATTTVAVHPNPAKDQVIAKALDGMPITMIEVLGMRGERLALQQAGAPRVVVDLSGLAGGPYVLRVHTAKGTASHRLLKQ
ncbi:MAG: T9SS type A sorting domain-containing protein [Flavobacteriales bacterium]|jgi:hypothetical protein|nr:T9SS type A sorting domain-containing protein [Flavobacteriales bacterium]